jgi:murein DD-endopeptidase MepM/ murein hydrolase activator NlpD
MISFPCGLKSVLAIAVILALPGCAIFSPSHPYLPSRGSVQGGQTVTVKNDENIYGIAREHNVSMRDLIVLNNLRPPYDVRPGQRIELPDGASSGGFEGGSMPPPSAAPLAAVEKNELAPIEPAGVSSAALAPIAASPTSVLPSSDVSPGSFLSDTNTAHVSSHYASVPSSMTLSQGKAQAMAMATPAPEMKPAPPPLETQKEPVTALNRPTAAAATPHVVTTASTDVAESTDMAWPVQGPILSAYGAKGAGLSNDGVNIGAPKGAPVVAAAPGIVVYAGDEMKGFGNLVLIRHQGDWVTAYAHLDRVLVKKDSVVGQGDEIGTVGKTGNVSTPQLHFETRHSGKPVDPSSVVKGNL